MKILLTVLVSMLWAPWVVCLILYSSGTAVMATVLLEAIVIFFWVAFVSIIWMVG